MAELWPFPPLFFFTPFGLDISSGLSAIAHQMQSCNRMIMAQMWLKGLPNTILMWFFSPFCLGRGVVIAASIVLKQIIVFYISCNSLQENTMCLRMMPHRQSSILKMSCDWIQTMHLGTDFSQLATESRIQHKRTVFLKHLTGTLISRCKKMGEALKQWWQTYDGCVKGNTAWCFGWRTSVHQQLTAQS